MIELLKSIAPRMTIALRSESDALFCAYNIATGIERPLSNSL